MQSLDTWRSVRPMRRVKVVIELATMANPFLMERHDQATMMLSS